MSRFERIFPEDKISKLERVELTLNHKTVDRVALHDQLSYSPSVVADYTGKIISGFSYSAEDIGVAIKKSLDMCFPPVVPLGVDTVTTEDGFIDRNDNWTSWHVSRPFVDEHGAAEWMKTLIARTAVTTESLEPDRLRSEYRIDFERIQRMVGESVICNYSGTGFSTVFDRMGLEIFSYFTHVYPELFGEFMEDLTAFGCF